MSKFSKEFNSLILSDLKEWTFSEKSNGAFSPNIKTVSNEKAKIEIIYEPVSEFRFKSSNVKIDCGIFEKVGIIGSCVEACRRKALDTIRNVSESPLIKENTELREKLKLQQSSKFRFLSKT